MVPALYFALLLKSSIEQQSASLLYAFYNSSMMFMVIVEIGMRPSVVCGIYELVSAFFRKGFSPGQKLVVKDVGSLLAPPLVLRASRRMSYDF